MQTKSKFRSKRERRLNVMAARNRKVAKKKKLRRIEEKKSMQKLINRMNQYKERVV